MKKLNLQQKMLLNTKRHKKKAPLHTAIAFGISFALLVSIPLLDGGKPVTADSNNLDEVLTMTMVGDMMLGRHVEKVAERKGSDSLFRYVKPLLKESDLVTGNFESPILLGDPEKYPPFDKAIRLNAGQESAVALKKAGFTSVNLANNHMMDYGGPGVSDTKKAFEQARLETVGAGRDRYNAKQILYQEVNGLKVATMGMTDVYQSGFPARQGTPGILPASPKTVLPLVRSAEKSAALVVVHIHWGVEYDNNVHPRQRDLGRALVDAGADIVVGHHPHVLEPVEIYKNGIILNSTGNFIFDQGWSRTRETALFRYRLAKNGTAKLEVIPMWISEGHPRPLAGLRNLYRREKIYLQLTEGWIYSKAWKKEWKREGDKLVRELDHSRILKHQENRQKTGGPGQSLENNQAPPGSVLRPAQSETGRRASATGSEPVQGR
ncbi:CapA family protein [Salinithrix halophila]|uniref:CapA family protein n=1 Tax=Salinithrix halophila TaxID=1485204 RepID=A0ABV8JH76_9BACL